MQLKRRCASPLNSLGPLPLLFLFFDCGGQGNTFPFRSLESALPPSKHSTTETSRHEYGGRSLKAYHQGCWLKGTRKKSCLKGREINITDDNNSTCVGRHESQWLNITNLPYLQDFAATCHPFHITKINKYDPIQSAELFSGHPMHA